MRDPFPLDMYVLLPMEHGQGWTWRKDIIRTYCSDRQMNDIIYYGQRMWKLKTLKYSGGAWWCFNSHPFLQKLHSGIHCLWPSGARIRSKPFSYLCAIIIYIPHFPHSEGPSWGGGKKGELPQLKNRITIFGIWNCIIPIEMMFSRVIHRGSFSCPPPQLNDRLGGRWWQHIVRGTARNSGA